MHLRARRFIVSLVIIAVLGLLWCYYDWRRFLATPLIPPQESFYYIFKPGMTGSDLAQDLQQRGFLTKPHYLIWLAKFMGVSTKLQAGEYYFPVAISPKALLTKIAQGDVVMHLLVLVEGWNFNQFMAAIHADPNIVQTLKGLTAEEIMEQVVGNDHHPEGWFFPDSYKFVAGMTDLAVLQRAYHTMQKTLQAIWKSRASNLPYSTPYEALIIASIIEKETALSVERPLVASVIINRLRTGMLLQVDPTVIYGLGDTFTGPLKRSHLAIDNPYNTYTRYGLPPTPIAMPSEASLIAAVNPARTDYFYFVARGDGSHKFSTTLTEQNEAIKKYRDAS